MAINYAANGSAEESGAAFTTRFSGAASVTVTRSTAEFSHGSASAHMVNPATSAFHVTYAGESTNVQGLGGLQVWAKFKWKGTGTIPQLVLQCYNAAFGAANNASSALSVAAPANWTYRVMGPVTMKAAGDIGRLQITFANDATTDGSKAFDIYVDEVMFTTFDPTNTPFFLGRNRKLSSFQLRPISQ